MRGERVVPPCEQPRRRREEGRARPRGEALTGIVAVGMERVAVVHVAARRPRELDEVQSRVQGVGERLRGILDEVDRLGRLRGQAGQDHVHVRDRPIAPSFRPAAAREETVVVGLHAGVGARLGHERSGSAAVEAAQEVVP